MKTKILSSFVFLVVLCTSSAFSATAPVVIWDGISTDDKEFISGTLNSAGDCTVKVGSHLPTGWAVDGAFNLKSSDKYIHMLPERTTADSDHCVSAEWSGTTTLTITGRDGFAAFGVFLSPVLYEIAFVSNGDDTTGTMSPMTDISYTATTTLRTNKFKRDGYVFSGWSLDSSDTEATFADAASVTGSDFDVDRDATNVTLYAVWTSASYGLDIDANGGTLADGTPEAGTCGTAFKVPKPTREGYTFKGWTLSGFNASTAKYGSTRAGCTTAVPSSGVVSATSAVWFLNLTAPDEDPVTLTAIWTPNTYKLSYATDGGTLNASNPTEATYGTAFLVYGPSASKLGYTFAGWELSNYSDSTAVYGTTRKVCTTTIPDDDFVAVTNGTSVYFNNLATTANKTVTLNAVWTEREATILVDGESVSITYETPYCVTALVSKVGCTFQGWTVANFNAETSRYGKDGACDTPFPADGVIKTTEDIWVKNLVATGKEKQVVFTPIWDGITYNIVYDLAGGTHGASHPERATFAAPKFLVSTPKRSGYEFAGWRVTGEYDPDTFYSETAESEDSRVVSLDGTTLSTHGDLYFRDMASKEGATVTLTALWTEIKMDITIDGESYTNACGEIITVKMPTKKGYTFDGWDVAGHDSAAKYGYATNTVTETIPSDGHIAATNTIYVKDLATTNNASVTFTPNWIANTYTIKYDANGGVYDETWPTNATFDAEEALLVRAPKRTGYTFTGWLVTNEFDSSTMVVTYEGSESALIVKPEGDVAPIEAVGDLYFRNMASKNGALVCLTAQWELNVATVTVVGGDADGADLVRTNTFADTVKVSLPAKTGYAFEGWAVTGFDPATARYGLSEDAVATPFPADGVLVVDATIYATGLAATNNAAVTFTPQWSENRYTVKYDLNYAGAAARPDESRGYEEKFLVPAPAREGYTFAGWRLSGEFDAAAMEVAYEGATVSQSTVVDVSPEGVVAAVEAVGDLYFRHVASKDGAVVTMTARWTENVARITVVGGGADGADLVTTNACGREAEIAAPKRTGYSLVGWDVAGYDPATAVYWTNAEDKVERWLREDDGHIAATNAVWVKNLAATNNAAVTFTPNWSNNVYEVVCDWGDGSSVTTNDHVFDEAAFLVSSVSNGVIYAASGERKVNPGYTFVGWKVSGEFDPTTFVSSYDSETFTYGTTSNEISCVISQGGEKISSEAVGALYFRNMASKNGALVYMTALWTNATTTITIDGTTSTNDYDTVIKIAAPEKAGWSFMGWEVTDFDPETAEYGLSEAACDTPFPADGVIKTTTDIWVKNLATGNEKQVVFTPIWEMNPSYGISYDEAGGTAGSSRPDYVEYSESVKISVPTRTGYTFTGWVISGFDPETACYGYNATCPSSVPSGGVLNVTRDFYVKCLSKNGSTVTFTAQWTNIAYKVSYDEAGGTAGSSRETSVDYDKVVAIDPPTRTGYTFKGWKFSGLGDGARYGTSAGSCNSTFPANGELDRSTTIYVKNLETEADATACFTAIWEGVTYSIDYDYDGGSVSKDNAASLVYGEAVRILAPKKSGFDFVGWYVYDACSDARWGLSAATCNQEIAVDANDVGFIPATGIIYLMNLCDSSSAVNTPYLVARWSDGSTAVVTFDANGGSVSPATKDYETGAKYGTLPTPTQEDKAFVGWFTAATGGSEVTATTTVEGTTTLYAHWTDLYTVAFKSNGGSGEMTAQKLPIGIATALATNAFTRTGYAFLGWAADSSATKADYADGAQVSALATTAGAEVDLYAVWQANTYTVVFDPNGGSGTMTSVTATYDVPFTLPACTFTSPTKMSFSAWSFGGKTYAAGAEVSNLTDEKDGSVTVKAVWTITLSDLSKAMDCTTLFWYSQDKTVATQWEVCEGEGYASTSCVTQENSVVRDRAPMAAELSGKETADEPNVKGTMTFWWKPASLSSQLQCGPAETADDYPGKTCRTVISAEGTNWQKVAVQVSYTTDKVGSANCYFVIDNVSPENLGTYECIDMVTWTPADTYPVPNAGDAVTGLSLSSHSSSSSSSTDGDSGGSGSDGSSSDSTASNDSLSLSFMADENFSYQVLRKESLTDREWTVEKTIEGVSGEQSVELPCNNSSGFYTIKTIQRTK